MISPMLLHHAEQDFVLTDEWVLELKYDGVRAILDTTGDVDVLYTRKGHDISAQFPEIMGLGLSGVILDGEIVGFDEGGFHKLNWVQRRLGVTNKDKIVERTKRFPVTYVAFDILNSNTVTFEDRRKRLEVLDGIVTISPVYPSSDIDKMWRYVKENNLEGLVAKRLDSKYLQGKRTYNWRKIKHEKPDYRE
jgi:bifunctional non-homologous end joining protein LigD